MRLRGAILALAAAALVLAAVPAREARAAQPMHASELAPCRPNTPQVLRTLPAFLTVHVACDHLLLEIPPSMLGRSILVYTEFSGLSAGASEEAPGAEVNNIVVRWVRNGNKVIFESVRYDRWAGDQSGLKLGIDAVSLPTVIDVFDVVKEGENRAPVIDVTALFTSHVPRGFGLQFMRHFRMARVDGHRSFIRNVRAFPLNIEIGSYQTWVPDDKDLLHPAQDQSPPPSSLGFTFKTNFMLLPEQPMQGRCEDERIGYFSVPFDDYSTNQHRVVKRAYIMRYRLEKKDPTAAVSEPVQPIVFYLSPEIPRRWKPYLREAVERWREPLEQAGFKNAIIVKDAPTADEDPDWDLGDLRYSVIRWAPGPREKALGPAVVDPRSGEVISSHTLVWHDVLRLVEVWYFTQVGPLDPRATKLPLPDDLEGELLAYVVSHEIGHALGLRHNFKAHSAYSVEQLRSREFTHKYGNSASIMDYSRFNYVAQLGDDAYLLPKIGVYDRFAIDWGYRTIPNAHRCDEEWPELDRLAERQVEDPALRFGGENEDAQVDPTVDTQVLGSDPIAATDMGLRNIDRVMAMLLPATSELGRPYDDLAEVYDALLLKREKELGAVAKLVGGVEETRYEAERGTVPFQPVSPARQRKAVTFLLERAFVKPVVLLDPNVLRRIGPAGGADALEDTSEVLMKQLIDKGVFQRMAEASSDPVSAAGSYQGADMLHDLNQGLFSELGMAAPVIDLYRRDQQRRYVKVLTSRLTSASSDDDVVGASEFTAALRGALSDLSATLEQRLQHVRDPQSRLHLKDLKAVVDKNL